MKNITKLLSLCVTIFLVVSSYQTSFAQDCDECLKPKIIYYDSEVSVGQPADSLAPLVFYWPFATAIDCIVSNSPECIKWTQGSLADIEYLEQGMVNAGPQNLMTAWEGGNNNWDYLIRSTVTAASGSEGYYFFNMFLETSPKRERVAISSVMFKGDLDSAKVAGLSVAGGMLPILEKIKTFEKNKRSTDTWIALANMGSQNEGKITITPQKTQVDTGETVDVNIKLMDCDGVPLGNRLIEFNENVISNETGYLELTYGTEGGTITPSQAYTDESGNATVQFKAGSKLGPAKIVVWYPHFTPPGRPHAINGTAIVQIGPPAENLFIVRANVSYSYSSTSDTTIKYLLGDFTDSEYHSQSVNIETNGRVTAIIENMAEDPSKDFYYYSEAEPISLIVSGSGTMNEFSKYEELIDGKLINADIRSDNVSGFAYPDASIEFDYTEDYKYAGIGVSIKATGEYTGKMFFYEWKDYGGDYDDYGLTASAGGSPEDGCTITKLDSTGYNAAYSSSESYQEPDLYGAKFITKKSSMTLSIAPYNGPVTGISKEERSQLFPKEFSLSQNYPNPFNPVTSITYQLKSKGMIKLKVYDVLGNEIAVLAEGIYPQGTYTVKWDASKVSSGVYFYSLQVGSGNGFFLTKKMIVLK